METDFKFKVGDIVKVTSIGSPTRTYICIITRRFLVGGKNKYYEVLYSFKDFQNVVTKNENDITSLLSEYWYINEKFEICKENKVHLNEQFVHRTYGFGVFVTEKDANYKLQNLKWNFKRLMLLC